MSNIPEWHPEYIQAGNLEPGIPRKVCLQPDTLEAIAELARGMFAGGAFGAPYLPNTAEAEAIRYAVEVGIVALHRANAFPAPQDTPAQPDRPRDPRWRRLKSDDPRKPAGLTALRAAAGVPGTRTRTTNTRISKDGQWVMGDVLTPNGSNRDTVARLTTREGVTG